MRFLVFMGILAAVALPASAIEKVTVAQLEQILAQATAKPPETEPTPATGNETPEISANDLLQHFESDALLPRLSGIELTERLSTPTLYRLVGNYKLGPRVQMALEEIADRSALLSLPTSEEPNQPAPDAKTETAIFTAARDYVIRRLSHLPNFVATRTTTTFDNTPAPLKYFQSITDGLGFRRVATEQRQITFQDGKEVMESGVPGAAKRSEIAFQSRGEFGTQAAVVLMDLEHGSVKFDHWENTMGGLAAVYQYSVPRGSSHYQVADRCKEKISFQESPAYHGLIALSPKTGAILRITLEADWNPDDPVSHVSSVVEYGPVVIGNRRSLCPLRSLAFLTQEENGCSHGRHRLHKPVTMINRTIFSNYHRFGSSSTMIFDEADDKDATPNGEPAKAEEGKKKDLPISPAASLQRAHP
jgi:hypothetical protein